MLKKSFIEIVENQIRDNDPPEAKQTFERLMSDGISEKDAKVYIGQAICVEIWDVMQNNKEFDSERYIRNLKKLPEEPTE